MLPSYLTQIHHRLYEAQSLGIRTIANGCILLGHVPHVAPQAWLHLLFAGLSSEEIGKLEHRLPLQLPPCLQEFYSVHNGLDVFSTELCIYGMRKNYIRTGDEAIQPFDLISLNTYNKPRDLASDNLLIGTYKQDASLVYLHVVSGKVYHCSEVSALPYRSWTSFDEFPLSEIQRIAELFTTSGKRKE